MYLCARIISFVIKAIHNPINFYINTLTGCSLHDTIYSKYKTLNGLHDY